MMRERVAFQTCPQTGLNIEFSKSSWKLCELAILPRQTTNSISDVILEIVFLIFSFAYLVVFNFTHVTTYKYYLYC